MALLSRCEVEKQEREEHTHTRSWSGPKTPELEDVSTFTQDNGISYYRLRVWVSDCIRIFYFFFRFVLLGSLFLEGGGYAFRLENGLLDG